MAQRCSYCGKTEKQHGGKSCFDITAFKMQIEALPALTECSNPTPNGAAKSEEKATNDSDSAVTGAK